MIEWDKPWFDAVRPTALQIGLPGPGPLALDAFNAGAARLGVANAGGQPLRFVAQEALPAGQAYEAFIGDTGCVPTRDNLHDYFNGLVWLAYPLIKRQLNAMQAAQIAQSGVGKSRGPTRDGVTIFDENAALLVVRDGADGRDLVDLLRNHQWIDALHARRVQFEQNARLWLFGHALMEKLVAPRKAITAHTRVVWVDAAFFSLPHADQQERIDARVARELAREGLDTSRFAPLPVLGVPGWWPDQDASFYLDASVFRPQRAG